MQIRIHIYSCFYELEAGTFNQTEREIYQEGELQDIEDIAEMTKIAIEIGKENQKTLEEAIFKADNTSLDNFTINLKFIE